MPVTVELTYDMSKVLGTNRFEAENPGTVAGVVQLVRERFGNDAADFEKLSRLAAVAVNGVLMNHRKGMRTRLSDGDRITFVKAAAGG